MYKAFRHDCARRKERKVNSNILAIDPGTTRSGYVLLGEDIEDAGKIRNEDLLEEMQALDLDTLLAVETIGCYGRPVGREVFETCIWVGRFVQAWRGRYVLVERREVKKRLGMGKAKDGDIRRMMIEIYGPPGGKKTPGPTYGVTGDAWQALALAHVARDFHRKKY